MRASPWTVSHQAPAGLGKGQKVMGAPALPHTELPPMPTPWVPSAPEGCPNCCSPPPLLSSPRGCSAGWQ